jgi:small GTP-binding protein
MARIVFAGDAFTGKTCIVNRIANDKFGPTRPNASVACVPYKSDNPDDPELHLWDTAGMEKYRSLNSSYYREASGGVLVFDLTSPESFRHVHEIWRPDFAGNAPDDAFIFLVGNKADLRAEVRISEEEARLYANSVNMNYFQTSAVTGEGIPELVSAMLRLAPAHRARAWDSDLTEAEEKKGCC